MKNITPKKFSLSKIEMSHLLRSWLALSFAFSILIGGFPKFDVETIYSFVISGISVGLGFILHEMAHKALALKYKCSAEFRTDNKMLLLMIGMSFFGFIFAVPGGVEIKGYLTRKQHGKIALSGPLTNFIIAIFFIFLFFTTSLGFIKSIAFYGLYINSWLAVFNMIPFSIFDGSKVFHWNKKIYYSTLGACIILLLVVQTII